MEQKIEALQTAYEYIPRLYKGSQEAAACFRNMQINKANELTIQIIDGLRWIIDVLSLTKDIQKKPLEVEKVKTVLREGISALENEDSILLGDILEYEVCEILEKWNEQLEELLAEHI